MEYTYIMFLRFYTLFHNAGHASSGIDHSSRPLPRQPYQSVSTPVSHTPTTAAVTQNPALVRRQHMPTAAPPVTSQLSQPIRKQEEDISSQLQNLEMGADNLSGTMLSFKPKYAVFLYDVR